MKKEFKDLQDEFNAKRVLLLQKYPNSELVVYTTSHPLFVGEKGLGAISFGLYDKDSRERLL